MPPTSSHLPDDPAQPHEEDYSDNFQTPHTHSSSSQPGYSQPITYPTQSYYPGAPASYPQSMSPRVIAPAPSYYYPSTMPGASPSQLPEGAHPPPPFGGGYGGPAPTSQRNDGYYYPGASVPGAPFGHQYMPFPQSHMGLQYPEPGQPPSPHPSTGSSTSQRPKSPDRGASDPRTRRVDEPRYGPVGILFDK
ncbi:hypothetical protein FRC12_014492 [Ceratobasidium sp. 428]|nr:hypothetical protein FRC12_014492 [Ceratobasidium sp. 428]